MKNLKKLLAALVVVTLLATSMMPAFAAGSYTYTTQAQALYDLGLYKGSSTTTFEPDLGSALDRQQGVVMLIRLLGKESAALALSDAEVNATLIIFSDAKDLASWAKKQIAYAVLYKYVAGLPNGTFAPNNALSGKEYCTMLLRALGYTVDAAGYAGACYQLSNIGGITFSEAAKFNDKELIRDDMVGISYGVLKADYKATGKSIIETMVETKVVTEAKAIAAGVYNTKLEEDAKAAIAAYKAAPITNLTEIAAAEAKKAAADAAVAKIVVAATKTALQKEIDDQAAKIAAKKKEITDADDAEKAAIADAEKAVKAYESASITNTTEVTAAEALGKKAETAVALVKTESSKTAFLGRITAQNKKIADKKVDLANVADATAAVNAYIAAPYNTIETIAEAERLGLVAEDKVAKIVDTTAKADLTKKINDQKALVVAKKIELNSASVAVTVDNFKTMKLVFSKAMDVNTLSTSTIKLNNGAKTFSVDTSKSEDKKTFILQYDTAATQSEEIKLTIEGAKDVNGVTLDKFEKTFSVRDIIDPVINSVQVVSAKTLRIYTSEPINVPTSNTVYSLFDGNVQTVNGTKMQIDSNLAVYAIVTQDLYKGYVQLEFQTPFSAGTHSLNITGLRDYAGFATTGTFSFTIAEDKTAPVAVSAEVIGTTKVKLTFNENIANAGGSAYNSNSTFYVLEAGMTDTAQNRIGVKVGTNVVYKDNTVTFELATPLTLLSTLGFDVFFTNISDAVGNTIAGETKFSSKAIDESSKPVLSNVIVEKDNTLKVIFSKKVEKPTGANFKLLYANKTLWSGAVASVDDYDTNNPDGMTYKVTIAQLLASGASGGIDAGNYILEVGDVKDTSIRQNAMDAVQRTIAVNDTKLPNISVISKISKTATNPFTLEIYFSEVMDASTINSKVNYFIAYSGVTVPLSSVTNATLSTTDNKKVVITITDISANEVNPVNEGTITGISILAKDVAGNPLTGTGAIGYTAYPYTAFAVNGTIPTNPGVPVAAFDNSGINTVKATETSKIKLTVKNNTDGSPMHLFANAMISLEAFDIRTESGASLIGTGPNDLRIIGAYVSADGKTLDITLNKQLQPDGKLRVYSTPTAYVDYTIYLYTTNQPVKNVNGINLSLAGRKIDDGIAPIQNLGFNKYLKILNDAGYDAVTKLAKNNLTDDSYLELTFNEAVKNVAGSSITDIAYGLEVKIGSKTLVAGIDYYTVFNSNENRSTVSTANGTSIFVKFTTEGVKKAKDTLKDDHSNISVRITNSAYIVDKDGSNKVIAR